MKLPAIAPDQLRRQVCKRVVTHTPRGKRVLSMPDKQVHCIARTNHIWPLLLGFRSSQGLSSLFERRTRIAYPFQAYQETVLCRSFCSRLAMHDWS
jgi:hypothetical protein